MLVPRPQPERVKHPRTCVNMSHALRDGDVIIMYRMSKNVDMFNASVDKTDEFDIVHLFGYNHDSITDRVGNVFPVFYDTFVFRFCSS